MIENILYGSVTSPYVRKVLILISEIGKEDQYKFQQVNLAENLDQILAVSSIGKIPVLVEGDTNKSLIESDLICRYLCNKFRVNNLFPNNFDSDFEQILAIINSGIDSSTEMIFELRRPQEFQYKHFFTKRIDRIKRIIAKLELQLPEIVNSELYLQIAMVCFLGYLNFRWSEKITWQTESPNLQKWFTDFSKKQSVIKTLPA
jgi:glutathione S-transferase